MRINKKHIKISNQKHEFVIISCKKICPAGIGTEFKIQRT